MASMADEHFDISFDHDEVLEMTDVSEIIVDGALLMELLDEYSHPLQEEVGDYSADQTSGAGGMLRDPVHPHDVEHCEDCGLDDILSDLHCWDCSRSAAPTSSCLLDVEDYPIDWNEMETAAVAAAAASPGSDMGEWYVDDCMHGMCFAHGDLDGYSSLFMHLDNSMDQFYTSLWE